MKSEQEWKSIRDLIDLYKNKMLAANPYRHRRWFTQLQIRVGTLGVTFGLNSPAIPTGPSPTS